MTPVAISSDSPQAVSRGEILHFDRIARPYRWLEYLSFGPLLSRTRTHWLPETAVCSRALVLGDGDGRFTASLLAANRQIRAHAVDISRTMLTLLENRCRKEASRLTVEQADLRAWSPSPAIEDAGSFDLIVTHFFLDCLTSREAADLAGRLTKAATPEATWLISDFAIPSTRYGRWIAAPVVALLYRAFGLITGLRVRRLPNHATALERAGWQLHASYSHAGGLLISQLWRRAHLINH
jgi:SAM-dependent methyltransferase